MENEIVDGAAAAADAGTGTVDTTLTDPAAGTQPGAGDQPAAVVDPNAAPDEFAAIDKLFGDLKPDDPAAIDPNAPAELPEAVTKALAISEYVKEPGQLESAIRAADEVYQVQAGKLPAYTMLEGLRANDPARFEKVVSSELIPYLEHITGKKFGGEGAAAPDPVKDLAAEVERLKQQPIIEAQQREEQQRYQQADTATNTKVSEFIKAGTGIFEGDTSGAIQAMAGQMVKMGLKPADVMKEVLSGKTDTLEKIYKATEKAEMLRVKSYVDRLKARSKTVKAAVPPSKGAGSPVASIADGKHDLTTKAGRTAAMVEAWEKGGDAVVS